MIIETTLQSFDTPNRNNRYYRLEKMKPAIERFMEFVKNKEAFGEFGHPTDTSIYRASTIHPQFISHIVLECWLDGNLLKGRVETVGPYGSHLENLIKKGRVGFSARVYASNWIRNEQGYEEPDGKIYIITYDAVIIPSHKEAYVESIVRENMSLDNNYICDDDFCIAAESSCSCNLTPSFKLIKL